MIGGILCAVNLAQSHVAPENEIQVYIHYYRHDISFYRCDISPMHLISHDYFSILYGQHMTGRNTHE